MKTVSRAFMVAAALAVMAPAPAQAGFSLMDAFKARGIRVGPGKIKPFSKNGHRGAKLILRF